MKQIDRRLLSSMSEGIPLARYPFRMVGAAIGLSENEVTARLRNLRDEGVIRRFGARVDHRRLGIVANAMVCWKVPEGRIEEAGRIISRHPNVTHCYEREIVPSLWEQNLFCVIHGSTVGEVKRVVREIEQETGISGHVILFSERKYKHIPFTVIGREDP